MDQCGTNLVLLSNSDRCLIFGTRDKSPTFYSRLIVPTLKLACCAGARCPPDTLTPFRLWVKAINTGVAPLRPWRAANMESGPVGESECQTLGTEPPTNRLMRRTNIGVKYALTGRATQCQTGMSRRLKNKFTKSTFQRGSFSPRVELRKETTSQLEYNLKYMFSL